MRMLRIVPLLIGFLAYNVRSSQAKSAYRYVINRDDLSGNGIEDAFMTPSSEGSLQRGISFFSGRNLGEEYDAANFKQGEEGDSYNFRDSERNQHGRAERGITDDVSVFFVMPRRELEEYPMSWREQEELKTQVIKSFLINFFKKAGQSRSSVVSHSATSKRFGSGDELGEYYVRHGGEELPRKEGVDTQDATDAQGVERGLLKNILGLLKRSRGRNHRRKVFSPIQSIRGRLPEFTGHYLGHVFSHQPNGGGQSNANIEIIQDSSRPGSLPGLFEGSADEEQLTPSTLNLKHGEISDVGGSRSSVAKFLLLLQRPRRNFGPRSHRSQVLYPHRGFPHMSAIQRRGRTVPSRIIRYWRHQPRSFDAEELLDDVGNLQDDNNDGIYDNEFKMPTSKLGRGRWKFYVYEGKPGVTHDGDISAYGRSYGRNRYGKESRDTTWNHLLRDSFQDKMFLHEG
uniref:Uncharacterized protein n=1 Tax=Rhipicephalus zambeziensis TaxID=60191 RepID=A0A224YFB8_9ACAR